MTTRGFVLSAAALMALCVPAAQAQSQTGTPSTTETAPDKPETIAQHKDNQQDQIAQGVQKGAVDSRRNEKSRNEGSWA